MNNVLSTTPQISAGASSATAPAFIPQRGASTNGFGGDSSHVYEIVGGGTIGTWSATGPTINVIPTSAGAGGLYICVDSSGVLYKKASCP